MISIEQYRSSIGLFSGKCPSGCRNKWEILKICAALALSVFLALLATFFRFFHRRLVKIPPQDAIRKCRSILYTTVCLYLVLYYFRASKFLFTFCADIHPNPGPFDDGFFKFCHWNCNSLKAHNFSRISSIQAYNAIHNFNIIAISETALTNEISDDKIDIPGYQCLRNDLPPQDTHGGVLIYHKTELPVKRRSELESFSNLLVLELSI